jgi:uncharacterized protein
MSERSEYPAGVPCWVENLSDDIERARSFYGELFGWTWSGPGPMAGDSTVPYFVALSAAAEVAGVAVAPDGVAPTWMTQVRVDSVDDTAAAAERAGGTVLAGPMDIGPVGRLVVVADPTGGTLCGFEPAAQRGARRVNEPGAWAMSVLVTADPDRAAAFYRELFGWPTESFGPFVLFRLDGYVGGEPDQPVPRDVVAGMVATDGEAARWDVDFWVADLATAISVVEARGGQVISAIEEAPPFLRATIADPAGARISLSQLVTPA